MGDVSKVAACIKMAAAKLGWVEEIIVSDRLTWVIREKSFWIGTERQDWGQFQN